MKNANVPSAVKSQANADDIDLFWILKVLWRGKFIVAFTAFVGFTLGGYYAFRVAVPIYPATALLVMETERQNVVNLQSVVAENLISGNVRDTGKINTEMLVIRSRSMMKKLVDHLDLMNDPKYNPNLREAVVEEEKSFLQDFSLRKFVWGLFSDAKPQEKIVLTNEQVQEGLISRLNGFFALSPVERTFAFQITARSTDRAEAVRMANGLAAVYIQDGIDQKFDVTEKASEWLSQKAAELKAEIDADENRLREFQDSTDLVSAENLVALNRQLKDMRQRLSLYQEDIDRVNVQMELAKLALAEQDIEKLRAFATRPAYAALAPILGNTRWDLTDIHTSLDRRMQDLKVESISATQKLQGLSISEQALKQQVERQSSDLLKLRQLEGQLQANGLLYESFITRLKEITLQQGLFAPTTRLLSEATPRRATSPRRSVIMMLTLLMGIGAGIGILFIREIMNNAFRAPEELEDYTNLRVLGVVPKLKVKTRKDVLTYTQDHPTSAFSESVNNLRTSILLADIEKEPQVIMITSSTPAEGKTSVSLSLAQNMSGLGKKVLLMECDIRKRIFSEYFDVGSYPGFVSLMMGTAELEDCLIKPMENGPHIISGDKTSSNATDVFSSQKFIDLLARLREEYDYIIIDTPPVLAVPDARVIARHADSIVYSVLWDGTTKSELRAGLNMLESVGTPVDGLILNMVDVKKVKKYGYSGNYGYYYGKNSYYTAD
ncbi:chain-length determining protein [Amylibacter marinus]|uniref:non-specific protein-tyrosine kinase n=1 Tax=Amylibacter marinus TaxID=1475483 RepID=A0ABQ5VXK6_9RHOB|nr:polysaccharide biosynthesis tyrosine autokinase [Amylibacter marinus]GLQ35954.1 chain-length determining protein [Amylibacter marinus]